MLSENEKEACDTAWEKRMDKRMFSPKMRRTNSGYIAFFDGFEAGADLSKEAMKTIIPLSMENVKHLVAWWLDDLTNAIINEGVRLGWLFRPSTTQVEWTEKGVEAIKSGS